MLLLITKLQNKEVEVERLMIWDFYLAFPREIRNIKFPKDLLKLKNKIFKGKEENPYEDLVNPKLIIQRMKPLQIEALKVLSSYRFIEYSLDKKTVNINYKDIPDELVQLLNNVSVEKLNVLKLVTNFNDIPLYGPHGIKQRTGLIDYKYDPN